LLFQQTCPSTMIYNYVSEFFRATRAIGPHDKNVFCIGCCFSFLVYLYILLRCKLSSSLESSRMSKICTGMNSCLLVSALCQHLPFLSWGWYYFVDLLLNLVNHSSFFPIHPGWHAFLL
jgi:hypothetical protein